ncbi:hypothetical protein ACWEWI_25435 [Streptomyces sp. NPDC003753]
MLLLLIRILDCRGVFLENLRVDGESGTTILMADRHEAGGFMTQTGTDALIHELYLRDYWIDQATLTRRLDEILADKSAQSAQQDLVGLYAAVYQTG